MKRRTPKAGSLDRFGTHRLICERLPKIRAESGFATAALLFHLWDRAVVKLDGRTRGDVSVSALARAIGSTRKTVAASLKYLLRADWITEAPPAEGKPPSRKKTYLVYHVRYGETDPGSPNE